MSRHSASDLLYREISENYRAQQTAQVAEAIEQRESEHSLNVIIFRIGREWLALQASVCHEILNPIESHIIPHRSNRTLLGVVNVRGQLLLKVSLTEVLESFSNNRADEQKINKHQRIEKKDKQVCQSLSQSAQGYSRMMVVREVSDSGQTDTWAFEVDELYGVHKLPTDALQAVAAQSLCTRHVFAFLGQQVNVLDESKLFHALRIRAL